jgi:hypothetical protein
MCPCVSQAYSDLEQQLHYAIKSISKLFLCWLLRRGPRVGHAPLGQAA